MALGVAREIAAPPEVVWDLLVDTRRWGDWGPTVRSATVETGGDGTRIGPGATGRVQTSLGPSLGFRITAWEPGRRWAWAVGGLDATGHRVEALGSDRCRAVIEVPAWAPPYLLVCALGLRRIERLATA